jgi:four helix bundle protein
MRPFRELKVWDRSHQLTLAVYQATASFPQCEQYGLVSQMRRSAASVPTNIAEGSVRSDAELRQLLRVALGSATELEYQLILSRDLGYLAEAQYLSLHDAVERVKRMLTVFIQRSASGSTPPDSRRLTADGGSPEGATT